MAYFWIQRILHSPFAFQLLSLSFCLFFVLGFRPPFYQNLQSFESSNFVQESYFLKVLEPGFFGKFYWGKYRGTKTNNGGK